MEYTVLVCWYRIKDEQYTKPGSGPYSKQVTALLAEGWQFKGEMKHEFHKEGANVYVLFIQEFTRTNYEEPYK